MLFFDWELLRSRLAQAEASVNTQNSFWGKRTLNLAEN